MPKVHFLNVSEGDCSIIEHTSKHLTMIDVCNAKPVNTYEEAYNKVYAAAEKGVSGNFNQKRYPVNPIAYMRERGLSDIFRFILTHPDMDHMDGLEALFREFSPANFWDTDNTNEKDFSEGGRFSKRDWEFYKSLRGGNPQQNPKRLTLFSGSVGQYYNRNETNQVGGDGLTVLAPTKELVTQANACEDHNDCSYVLLYRTSGNRRVLFAGDSHDSTWDHILSNHEADVRDVDVLIAPHHGRDSERSYDFLDVVNPVLTLFGNARSEHLAYSAWSYRSLPIITNNQAGSILIDLEGVSVAVYVTCRAFADASCALPFENAQHKGYYYWGAVERKKAIGA